MLVDPTLLKGRFYMEIHTVIPPPHNAALSYGAEMSFCKCGIIVHEGMSTSLLLLVEGR